METAIEQAKQYTLMMRARLLNTINHMSDDRLIYTPTPTAKSALRIAAHIGLSNQFFAAALRGNVPSFDSLDDMMKAGEKAELSITTREMAEQLLEESTNDVINAISGITPERYTETIDIFFTKLPVAVLVQLVARHIDNHAAQIEYIQTCYGDMSMHM